MSERRTILSRPRTKVYESNYNIGESYYKPMVDHLDRKYSGRPLYTSPPREIKSSRLALDDEYLNKDSSVFDRNNKETDFFERANNAVKEADAFFDRHGRRTDADAHSILADRSSRHRQSDTQDFFDRAVTKAEESFAEKSHRLKNKADDFIEKSRHEGLTSSSRASVFEDEVDDTITSQLKRINASRAARDLAREDSDLDFSLNGTIRPTPPHLLRYKFGFHDKMLDTVGINGRFQERLVEDIIRRRHEPELHFPEGQLPSMPTITGKWSKVNELTEEETQGLNDVQTWAKIRYLYGVNPTIKMGYNPFLH